MRINSSFELWTLQATVSLNQSPSSLFVLSDQLFLGCTDGSLHIYSITATSSNRDGNAHEQFPPQSDSSIIQETDHKKAETEAAIDPTLTLNLSKSIINFTFRTTGASNNSGSSIEGISAIKEINSLVVLYAGDIHLYDLGTLELQSTCEKWTKSQASTMCLETSILRQNKQGVILDAALFGGSNDRIGSSKATPIPQHTQNLSSMPPHNGLSNSGSPLLAQSESIAIETDPKESFDLPVLVTILAVPCKRRLVLFCWKDGEWLTPKEITLPHQARSLAFATPLKLFIGYSTGDYATLKISLPSDNLGIINHEISEAFPLPVTQSITNRGGESALMANATLSSQSNTSNPSGLVSGLSGLALKTGGLVGLAGPSKVEKNPVIKVGPPTHEVIGMKDNLGTLMNYEGKLSRTQSADSNNASSIIYPAQPSETIIRFPYVLSLVPPSMSSNASLLVHSLPTLSPLQTLNFQTSAKTSQPDSVIKSSPSKRGTETGFRSLGRRLLTAPPNMPTVAFLVGSDWSSNQNSMQHRVECLQLKPWTDQVRQLIEAGEYDESLALIKSLDMIHLPNKAAVVKRLNALCAVIQFSHHLYDQAIDTFIQLSVNPVKVIALYPPQISGKLTKGREEWEALFEGRSINSYMSSKLGVSTLIADTAGFNESNNRYSMDLGSRPSSFTPHGRNFTTPAAVDDDRRSVRSSRSPRSYTLKAKPSELVIQKPLVDESKFRPSVDVLIRYLTDRRQHINKAFAAVVEKDHNSGVLYSDENEVSPLEPLKATPLKPPEELFKLDDRPLTEIEDIQHLVQIAKVIDTSLFKCYLAVKPTMLGPLCRLPNWCEIDEVESLLMSTKKYHELLDLYRGKNQHARALKLLKTMSETEEDIELRIDPTIRYLQKLGPKHIDLILNTSEWVFSLCITSNELIKYALEIFIADLSTVESLPRSTVINFLEAQSLTACQFYLEHLIQILHDETSNVHEKLIHIYIIECKRLRSISDLERAKAMYKKLLDHLLQSKFHSSNWVLGRLPQDDMYEARALTLGNMGQHDAALSIYVYRLANTQAAEEYCKRLYSQTTGSDGGQVFLALLRICLRPQNNSIIKALPVQSTSDSTLTPFDLILKPLQTQELLDSALRLISDHGNKIQNETLIKVFEVLPNLINLDERLQTFIMKSFRKLNQNRTETLIWKECSKSRLDQLDIGLRCLEDRRVKIDDKRLCIACAKRLGNSAIAVHPPFGEVTHYQCRERYSKQDSQRQS